jgi:hypothetical protein
MAGTSVEVSVSDAASQGRHDRVTAVGRWRHNHLSRVDVWAYLQQSPSASFGGQTTDPYEQNTKQSPGFGRNIAWQLGHS